jgi:hypothetical protein
VQEVKIIARSRSDDGPILTTAELYYPRMVHADFMTHRVLSRNASSSRATPVAKLLEKSLREMHIPTFRKNKPGMQPGDYLLPDEQLAAEKIWIDMAEYCARAVTKLAEMGVHKQWANRPLEWFGHIRVVVSATDWKNFFALRKDVDDYMLPIAQDEIYYLAQELNRKMEEVEPTILEPGQWHLPYVIGYDVDWVKVNWEYDDYVMGLIKSSVARCGRVSFDNLDGTSPDMVKDLTLYEKLVGSEPLHASPSEHQATPDILQSWTNDSGTHYQWLNSHLSGNFSPGWIQYRKLLKNEWVPG